MNTFVVRKKWIYIRYPFSNDDGDTTMQYFLLLFFLLCAAPSAFAQPSDAAVTQRLKSENPKILSVKFSSSSGSVNKILKDGVWVYEYQRSYTLRVPTEYEGITQIIRGTDYYIKTGSSYSFSWAGISWREFEGIPNPSEEDVMRLAAEDPSKALAPFYEKIVGEVESLGLAEDPKWEWLDINSVTVQVRAVYAYKDVQNTVKKVEKLFEWRLYRDDMKDPFNQFIASPVGDTNATKVLSSKQYSDMEFIRIKTLADMVRKKKADARFDKLPKLSMPDPNDLDATSEYLHKLLKEADAKKIEAFLFQALSSKFIVDGIPSDEFERLLKKTVDQASRYQQQYCDRRINVKKQDKTIAWYGKTRTWHLKAELNMVTEYEQPKISKIYLVTENTPNVAELNAFDCAGAPAVYEAEKPHTPSYVEPISPVKTGRRDTISEGTAVLCKYASDGYWYPANIVAVQGSNYQVKFLDGYATTVGAQDLVVQELAVNHLAHIRTNRGIIITTITKIAGDSYTLKTDTGGSMTVVLKQLRFK